MTARDELRAASTTVQLHHKNEHGWLTGPTIVALVAAAERVLAEPSAAEVLERLRAFVNTTDEHGFHTNTAAMNAQHQERVRIFGEIDRMLASLDKQPEAPQKSVAALAPHLFFGESCIEGPKAPFVPPQPKAPEAPQPEEKEKWRRSRGVLATQPPPQPKAPEPSADARDWTGRMQAALGSKGVWDAEVCDLADEAVASCAAADQRARRAEAALGNDPFRAARSEEMRRLREERDLARQQAHEAHERADAVKMQLDDTIGRLVRRAIRLACTPKKRGKKK